MNKQRVEMEIIQMTEFLTCRNIGFMFGCFGFSLARLGCFWVGIAECGSCWAVGVIMVFRWCLRHVWALHLRSVSGFVVLWVVGVLCLGSAGRIGGMSVVIWWRLGGVSVMSWCNPGGVSVFSVYCVGGHVCASCCVGELFYWCCGGILAVLLVIYFNSLACACLAGVGIAFFGCESVACERSYGSILGISMVSCISAHGRATQHQTILHACGP